MVPTTELLTLQRIVYELIADCEGVPPHIVPGEWTPHVTLSRRIQSTDLGTAVVVTRAGSRDVVGTSAGIGGGTPTTNVSGESHVTLEQWKQTAAAGVFRDPEEFGPTERCTANQRISESADIDDDSPERTLRGYQTLTQQNFKQTVEDNDIVLVDFWASWCGPCRNFAPTFDASSEKHPDVVHGKMDTEAEQEFAAGAGIRSIPRSWRSARA